MSNRHYIIYHRYHDDPTKGRIPDLEIDVQDPEKIVRNERLLSVFQTLASALRDEGLSVTVTGDDNEW